MLSGKVGRWSIPIAVCLAFLVPFVVAQGLAGAYERVMYYYTYRMAVATYGKNQNKILPNTAQINCASTGTHSSGGCNFREFVNYVNQNGGRQPLEVGFFGNLDLENPEVHEAARILNTRGEETRLFNVRRLFAGPNMIYDQVFPKIRALVEDCRSKNTGLPSQLFDNIQKANKEIIVLRQSDMFSNQAGTRGLIADLPNKYPGAQLRLHEEAYEHDQNRRVFSMDEEATIRDSPANTFPSAKDLKNWVSRYGKDLASSEEANLHYKVIKECRLMRARFSRSC